MYSSSTTWSKTSVAERSSVLLKIADVVEANADRLAKIETVDNGKAVRESMAADLPLVVDHFRYFAGVIRAEEGSASEIDGNTLSLCIQEPLGVVGQIIPCVPNGTLRCICAMMAEVPVPHGERSMFPFHVPGRPQSRWPVDMMTAFLPRAP